MIKNEFWKQVADVWSQKETIEIPAIDEGIDLPDELNEDEKDFDDWDEMDDFFSDILNG